MKLLKVTKFVCALLFVTALSAGSSWAAGDTQATAAGQNAMGTERSALDAVREKTALSYYGLFSGGPVSDPGASYQTTEWGKKTQAKQGLLNYLNLSYKASATLLPGFTVLSTYTPVRGQDLTLLSPYFRLTDTAFIRTSHFNLYSELRYLPPVMADDHYAHRTSGFGTFQWATYYVPGTRLSVGAWAKFYRYIYSSDATPLYINNGTYLPANDYYAFLRPQLFYTITPTVSAAVYYEMVGYHLKGKPTNDWYNGYTNLQIGGMWSATQSLTINPYLLFKTGGKVTTDTTALGAQIFATIL